MESDLQGLETSSTGTLDTLNTVVAWLHQEGFYAAESALLGEVENRYPDHVQSRPSQNWDGEGSTQYPEIQHAPLQQEDDTVNLSTTSCLQDEFLPEDVPSSAERCAPPLHQHPPSQNPILFWYFTSIPY